jgi:hypothetical protein
MYLLGGSYQNISNLWNQYSETPARKNILDAEYFLQVAGALQWGSTNGYSSLGQQARVQETLNWIVSEEPRSVALFGVTNLVDFSQFKLRGNYSPDPQNGHTSQQPETRLKNYFKTLMWLQRIDLHLIFPSVLRLPLENESTREFGLAVVLNQLLRSAPQGFSAWKDMDRSLESLFGLGDSINFHQLNHLLIQVGLTNISQLSPESISLAQQKLLQGEFDVQEIHSDLTPTTPQGTNSLKLPQTFRVFSQRFTPESWALTRTTYDRIFRTINGERKKVLRRIPSSLDIAFAVLGNRDALEEIIRRIEDVNGVEWRDGYEYQHNLLAAKETLDEKADLLKNSVYKKWLEALRELSVERDAPLPETMKTKAWSQRMLNSQLAGWTQLKNDTLLYTKQSYSPPVFCSYPKAYVEPLPRFWRKMKELAKTMETAVEPVPGRNYNPFFDMFADHMEKLAIIAEKQLAHENLTEAEVTFLNSTMELEWEYAGRQYKGWYPNLFYRNKFQSGFPGPDFNWKFGCDRWDALITDVHTVGPYLGADDGFILHQAVGNVNLMLITVDCGTNKVTYAGPVLSHYEVLEEGFNRLTRTDWEGRLLNTNAPIPTPSYTRDYLVPK